MKNSKVYPINAIEDNEETPSEEEITNNENKEDQVYVIKLKDEEDRNHENDEAVDKKIEPDHAIEINNEDQNDETTNNAMQGKNLIDINSNE